MKKLVKIGLVLFGIGLLSGFAVYMYVFHKPHRNILKEKPAYVLNAEKIYYDFSSNEESSYAKYANKVIQLHGEVVDIDFHTNNAMITMNDFMQSVNCNFDSLTMVKNYDKLKNVKVGDKVELKGQCDGYDMIMGVVLTSCVLL
jgi:hypothetical protein